MNVSQNGRRAVVFAGLLGLALIGMGCGADSNEKEFLESAPPGKPSEFPDEKVSERRQRLKGAELTKKKRGKPTANQK